MGFWEQQQFSGENEGTDKGVQRPGKNHLRLWLYLSISVHSPRSRDQPGAGPQEPARPLQGPKMRQKVSIPFLSSAGTLGGHEGQAPGQGRAPSHVGTRGEARASTVPMSHHHSSRQPGFIVSLHSSQGKLRK